MLNLRYDTPAARDAAQRIAQTMRDAAYDASADLAVERGAFPLFNADLYLSRGTFASRLPPALKDKVRAQGLRNSHLLSIAPTGTISLAFADNASNGIEPPFSWSYTRKKRMPDGSAKEYAVEDHAWRLYRHLKGADAPLTDAFVTALEMSAESHAAMVAAVAPYVDTAISKTVNVPADYPFADFEGLYRFAWKSGLKGLATYRPNAVLGSVLSTTPAAPEPLPNAATSETPQPLVASTDAVGQPRRPAPHARSPVHRGDELAALARPSRDERRQPGVDVHDPPPARRVRAVRRRDARAGRPRLRAVRAERAVRGVGQRRRAAARPGRAGQDAVDGHARQRSRVAQAQARRARHRLRGARVRHAVPARRRAAPVPRRGRGDGRGDPLALRAARRAGRRRPDADARRDVQPRRAAHRHRRHAGLGRRRRQPGHRRDASR